MRKLKSIKPLADPPIYPDPTPGEIRLAELQRVRGNIARWILELTKQIADAKTTLKTSKDSKEIAILGLAKYDEEIEKQFQNNVKYSQRKKRS